jgi:hypothetical protein
MLLINQVVESIHGEQPFELPARVLWLDRDLDIVTFITIRKPLRAPWSMSLSETEVMMRAEKLRLTSIRVPEFMMRVEEDLSEIAKEVRQRCWDVVQPLIEGPEKDRIYHPGALGGIVSAHAKLIGKEPKSVYRLLYRFWVYGLTRNAFLDNYANSGAAGKSRVFRNGKKPGRPRMYLGERVATSAKLLTDDDKSIIKIGFALFANNEVKHISGRGCVQFESERT